MPILSTIIGLFFCKVVIEKKMFLGKINDLSFFGGERGDMDPILVVGTQRNVVAALGQLQIKRLLDIYSDSWNLSSCT